MFHFRRPLTAALLFLLLAMTLLTGAVAAQSPSAAPAPTCAPVPSAAAPAASPDASPAAEGDLTVFAAASLTKPFGELEAPWEAAHPGSHLVFSFDASSALRTQIEQGAPADVLASADTKNPQALADECLAAAPATVFAQNHLVIVVPAGNPAGITSPADLAKPGVKVVAAGPDVPITKYANQVIDNLAKLSGYPADFAAAVAANVVSEEDNVKAVLAKIELGEGDAAIVYVTDAKSSTVVETVAIPDEANVTATYAAVGINDAADPTLASDFLAFLTGTEAQTVLAGYGFLPALAPAATTLSVSGLVDKPLTLSVADLASLAPQTVDVTFEAKGGAQKHTYTGVLLSDVIGLAGLTLDKNVKNQALHRYLVVTANDGYEVVVSWGEIDPSFGDHPYLLAWEEDGKPLAGDAGPVRLVTPGDVKGGRYVTGVTGIEARDIDSAPR